MKLARIATAATAAIGLTSLGLNSASAALNFGTADVSQNIAGDSSSAATSIPNLFNRLALFLGLIAVAYAVYGGYLYLTAGGNDDQTKQAKGIFKNVAIGLVIIFLAYSIVITVMNTLFGSTGTGSQIAAPTTTTTTPR